MNIVLEARAVLHATPIVMSRCARDALPHTYNIGVFKTVENNSTMIKHINN